MAEADICTISLTGNLAGDPELRTLGDGQAICRMRLGYNRRVRGEAGWSDRANFVDLVCYAGRARLCAERLRKGAGLAVSGELRHLEIGTRDGVSADRYEVVVSEIRFLEQARRPEPEPASVESNGGGAGIGAREDDDIPF